MYNKRQPSQRQLRVSEEIRHILSSILLQKKNYEPSLMDISITVSEVRVSPDLRRAIAYVYPLGGKCGNDFIDSLNKISQRLSHQVSQSTTLKYSPKISFKLEDLYTKADNIESIISSINDE